MWGVILITTIEIMKNKDLRKIQFGGWGKRSYKEIRNKVNNFDMDEDEVGSFKSRKKKSNKNLCAKTKRQHNFGIVNYEFMPGKFYKRVICEACGYVDHWRTWRLRGNPDILV